MTEADWGAATEPETLIDWLFFDLHVIDRKSQLFSIACCRRVEHRITDSLFLALVNAECVYKLFDTDGLGGQATWPPSGLVLHTQSYYMHEGRHSMQADDWDAYLAFLEKHFAPR